MAASHETVLIQALEAAATGNVSPDIFTDDVVGWTPNLAVSSRAELEKEWGERDEALSNVSVAIPGIHIIGDKAIAEFRLSADHTGPLVIDDVVFEPTGKRGTLAGAIFAEFRGDQIASFRCYFDDAALLEQLLF
jgi:hypothetical protein